jgi:hypothetical protein
MYWLYLVVAAVLVVLASLKATPGWLMVLLLLGALGLFIAWMLGLMASRVSGATRSELQILSPDELRLMREQAEARKAAAASQQVAPGADEPPG